MHSIILDLPVKTLKKYVTKAVGYSGQYVAGANGKTVMVKLYGAVEDEFMEIKSQIYKLKNTRISGDSKTTLGQLLRSIDSLEQAEEHLLKLSNKLYKCVEE